MYKINKESYGLLLTFSGHLPKQEMEQWLDESKEMLQTTPDEFVVFVDMREMELLPPESRPLIIEGQKYYRANGMQRSVVILKDKITMMQFKGIAKETGIYEWERYIDSNAEPNWKQVAMAWILDNVDPDDKAKTEKIACEEPV